MQRYANLHWWMLLPMVLMQGGIYGDYWGDFASNAWSVHVHYWTGSAWYAYLIVQPYLATHGRMAAHRTNGMIGMFLAGGVCVTALAMLHRDMANAQNAAAHPERFGPFEPWFFMGVAVVEFVMMVAFGVAVVMSIVRRKQIEDHAWWLISTVFLIMMPALGRGLGNLQFAIYAADLAHVDVMAPLYLTQAIIIGLTLVGAWHFEKLRHPATSVAVGVNLFVLLLEPLGRWAPLQDFLRAVIRG